MTESEGLIEKTTNQGKFLRKFNVIKGLVSGCSYRLDIAEGCLFNCKYCFLQSYLSRSGRVKIFTNTTSIEKEIEGNLPELKGKTVSLGVLNDSFFPIEIFYEIKKLIPVFQRFPEVKFELRTKSSLTRDIIKELKFLPSNCIPVFSFNSEKINCVLEKGTASLTERLASAVGIIKNTNLNLGFVFDPIIIYPGWEEDYSESVRLIKTQVPGDKIDFFGLGMLRLTNDLYHDILFEGNREVINLVFNRKFIKGNKDKYIYPIFTRLAGYNWLLNEILKRYPDQQFKFYLEHENIIKLLKLNKLDQEGYVRAE